MSDNKLTGTSLEVLSFMSSGIKKRTGSEYSDGRPGRINYHSEDEYRTITLLVQSTAYDMQDVAHLRDAVNELFDGELMLREMRIKSVKVEYESPGRRTGEMQLGSPEYVNGKQIKVAMVNSPEIDDAMLVNTFTVEFETTESPYFETIYTTLELHDSGYSATAEKYGLVDNIDDEKVKYRFKNDTQTISVSGWNDGGITLSNGVVDTSNVNNIHSNEITVAPGMVIDFEDLTNHPNINYWRAFEYNGSTFIRVIQGTPGTNNLSFIATGDRIRFATSVNPNMPVRAVNVGVDVRPQVGNRITTTNFKVYNAGNVTIEPESILLHIFVASATGDSITIKNNTTGETFTLNRKMTARHIQVNGMVVTDGTAQVFRDTNKRFISLAPGDNSISVTGATFNEIRFNFKYYYK